MKRLYLAWCASCGRVGLIEVRGAKQGPSEKMAARTGTRCGECVGPGNRVDVVTIGVDVEMKIWVPPRVGRIRKRKAKKAPD